MTKIKNFSDNKFEEIFDDGAYRVFEIKDHVPRVFLTSDFIVETDDQKIIDTLFLESFDRTREIILEEDPKIAKASNKIGSAKIIRYGLNNVSVETENDVPSLLFLSDVWYPGWIAKVDGKESKIYRADYTFRAVVVPAGKHKVEFIYSPDSFKYGVLLAIAGVIGILSMLYFGRLKNYGRN